MGTFSDRFLDRRLPYGEARILWEVGLEGSELRALRSRLELDSGYLSRVLRSLEAAGFVKVVRSPRDGRIRVAQLTKRGRAERDAIDRASDAVAESMIELLRPEDREKLVAAMRTVERLLVAGSVELREMDPADPDAQFCLASYYAELNRRSEKGFDPAAGISAEPHEMTEPNGCFLVAYLHGEPIGCGGVKYHPGQPCEIKRMWVAESARGTGLGRRLLAELEQRAIRSGARLAHIETNDDLVEAISLYRSVGYVEVDAFNDEPFADRWFEKRLTP